MRILFLSNLYPPADRGGWEQWCQEVADAFAERGHDVWVLTSKDSLDLVEQPEQRIIRSLYLESDLEHYRPLDFFLYLGRRDKHNFGVLRETIEKLDPDIIFIWGMWQLNPCLARLAEEMRPGQVAYYFCGYWPIEADPHSSYWLASENKRWLGVLKKPLGQLAMAKLRSRACQPPRFRRAAFVSRAVQEILEDGGVEFGQTRVIYGGVDLDQFRRGARSENVSDTSGPLRILYAGSLSEAKGVDTLLRASALLALQYTADDFNVAFVGAGHPEFEHWAKSFVADNGLQEYVSFKGRIDHNQMPKLIKCYDVLAFPSTWQEPLARMMMEGLAVGLVLVSTTTGGTGEVLENGVNSLTFEASDHAAMARQLGRLLDQPALRPRLRRAGQQTAWDLFDFERMVDDLESFVKQLLPDDAEDKR